MKKNLFYFIILWSCISGMAYDFEVNGIYYTITSTTDLTVEVAAGDSKYTGNIVIPSEVHYKTRTLVVKSIGPQAFRDCGGLNSVTIPNSVTSIGEYAFYNCSGLTAVTIPNSVTSIGQYTFYGCSSLSSVTIPNSVTSIGGGAFRACFGLTSVTIPNSVTKIGYETFYNCSGLTSITIPNSVTWIESKAFYNCSGLTSITIPNSVTGIESNAFYGCSGLTEVTIPNSVKSIGSNAFYGCSGLTAVTIGNSVTSIGEYAFYNCSGLTAVTIPNSVTSIRESAFYNCSGLTAVTIGNSVTSIGKYAFWNCSSLSSVTIPNSVTSIGSNAFSNCTGLKSLTLEDGDKDLIFSNPEEHYENPLDTLYIGRNTRVGTNSTKRFKNENIKVLIIGDSVTSIEDSTFVGCSRLNSVTIGNSVRKIGNNAFRNFQELKSVTIGNSVTSIGQFAFEGCSGLTAVTIGNSVTSIGRYAFYNCEKLKRVNISDIKSWCGIAFSDVYSNPLTFAHHLYLNGEEIKDLIIPNSVTSIGEYAFYKCSGLTAVNISNVRNIGNHAFDGCSELTAVNISNVRNIGIYAFRGCSKLTAVTTPNCLISIENGAFSDCSGLTSITISSSVTSIGSHAFSNCTGLKSLTFEDGDKDLYFSSPTGLNVCPLDTLYLGRNCILYGVKEFPNKNIKVLIVGNYVKNLGSSDKMSSFKDCSELKSVTIGNSVTYIGSSTFSGCEDIETIVSLSTNPPDLISGAFENTVYTFGTLFVPANAGSAYRSHSVWGKFAEIVELVYVANVSFDKTSLTFSTLNTTQTLTATITPSNASNKTLTWTSSNTNVATVSSSGVVTSKGNGTATITATTTDGSNKSATCSVTVSAPILVTGVSLSQTSLTFSTLNTTQTLTATVTPSNADNKTLTWTSSNTNVAIVNSDGVVTAKGKGTAIITATTTDGSNKSATCTVTVNPPVLATSVSIDKSTLSFTSTGQASRLTATVLPANTTNKSVTWTSSNTNVATVDANGLVTAKSSGTATITATTTDGTNLKATCQVTVMEKTPYYYEIAEEPSATFVAGKSYVLKNAYNNKYLSTNGGTAVTVNQIEESEIWKVEKTSTSDYVYMLKSVAKDGYFQYVNYGLQTWDETTPYDGYDWYDYAGFNGEFGPAKTAQEFTILRAVEAGEEDANNTPGSGKAVKEGSYIFAAKDQILGKWFKLGVSDNDVALEPYNEDVAWYFYEATPKEDAAKALELAIAIYGNRQMKGGDAPGYYIADAVEEYNSVVSAANEAVLSSDEAAKREATAALKNVGKKEFATNPIVEGRYFIVSAGDGPGYFTGATPPDGQWFNDDMRYAMYNSDGTVKWDIFNKNMQKFIYTFEKAEGGWAVKNDTDNTYVGHCVDGESDSYSGKVSTTKTAIYAQQFELVSEGKFFMTFVADRSLVTAYALTNSHNGSKNGTAVPGNIGNWGTLAEAKKFGVNVWHLIPAGDVKVSSISLDKAMLTLTSLGQTSQLTATVLPTYAANKTLTWSSSNTNVATVSSSGVVTSKSNGTATITATTTDGTNLKATCQVTVQASATVPGDLTGDDVTDVSDIVAVISYALDVDNPAGDVTGDGVTDVADIVAIIEYALNFIDPNAAPSKPFMTDKHAMAQADDVVSGELFDREISLSLSSQTNYTAFQFMLTLPEGVTLSDVTPGATCSSQHGIVFKELRKGCYKVIGYASDNRCIKSANGELLRLKFDKNLDNDAVISNVYFATPDAEKVKLNDLIIGEATNINAVRNIQTENDIYYDLHGRRITNPVKGNIYLHNGKTVEYNK